LKTDAGFKVKVSGEFPILGGRLLKWEAGTGKSEWLYVSNPWREAIEGPYPSRVDGAFFKFPILGGRLLKKGPKEKGNSAGVFPILGGRLLKYR